MTRKHQNGLDDKTYKKQQDLFCLRAKRLGEMYALWETYNKKGGRKCLTKTPNQSLLRQREK